jgi:hypothetical protein
MAAVRTDEIVLAAHGPLRIARGHGLFAKT